MVPVPGTPREETLEGWTRLRLVFGEVLPDPTANERDEDDADQDADRERWYRENRPPHHDPR
jgi:hypothetical protein